MKKTPAARADHPWLSVGAQRLIRRIRTSENKELDYFRGDGWWIGPDKTHGQYPQELLRLCLLDLVVGTLGDSHEVYELKPEVDGVLERGEMPLFVKAMRELRRKK